MPGQEKYMADSWSLRNVSQRSWWMCPVEWWGQGRGSFERNKIPVLSCKITIKKQRLWEGMEVYRSFKRSYCYRKPPAATPLDPLWPPRTRFPWTVPLQGPSTAELLEAGHSEWHRIPQTGHLCPDTSSARLETSVELLWSTSYPIFLFFGFFLTGVRPAWRWTFLRPSHPIHPRLLPQ